MSQDGEQAQLVADALARYEQPLLRFATRIVGPAHAADVVQDTFLKLCAADAEQVRGHVASWLFTVCRNRALDHVRQRRHREESGELDHVADSDPSPSGSLERKQAAAQVLAALSDLSERERHVVELRFIAELSYKEIAEATTLTVSHVGVILHNAIKAVRTNIEQEQRRTLSRRLS